jgi:hypothetical protein
MSSSIAGATQTGHVALRYTANSKLSQIPAVILPMVLQEAGAIIIKSAQRPNSTWLAQVELSASPTCTLFLLNVSNTSGDAKSVAEGVITTLTDAPFLMSNLVSNMDL